LSVALRCGDWLLNAIGLKPKPAESKPLDVSLPILRRRHALWPSFRRKRL
jgi:hypothetical protein